MTVETDRISVAKCLLTGLTECLLTGLSILLVFFTKLGFIAFNYYIKLSIIFELFLSSRRLWVVWKYKSFTLEYVRILFWSISFFLWLSFFPDDVLCKIAIWTDDTALNSSCDKASDLLQQAEIWVVIWSQKSKLLENISIFHLLLFDFEVSRFDT